MDKRVYTKIKVVALLTLEASAVFVTESLEREACLEKNHECHGVWCLLTMDLKELEKTWPV